MADKNAIRITRFLSFLLVHMHPMGHETMTSPSTLFLKGEEMPFELELIGRITGFHDPTIPSLTNDPSIASTLIETYSITW